MAILAGIHPILEALRAANPLERVHIAKGAANSRIQQIIDLCRESGIPVRFEDRVQLDRLARGSNHQGAVALGGGSRYASLHELPPDARLVAVLDGIEDPHNLGAIIRSAHAAGAGAILIPERRAAGLSPSAIKAAAGALEYLPIVRETNINRALEKLKQAGFWIYGFDQRGQTSYHDTPYNTPTAFVFGAEGKGLHQQVKKHCDALVSIPMAGKIASLNVSVAAGIALFDWKRRYHQH
jgi:23S rRNA (guanosine2251-2'-O)-methyltransferase